MSKVKFDEELVFKYVHEFAMQTLGDAQRLVFESCSDKTKEELFKENLAAGQGFYQGARWQFDQLQSELAKKDELLRECEEALVHYSHINFVEGQDWTLKARLLLQKLREGKNA